MFKSAALLVIVCLAVTQAQDSNCQSPPEATWTILHNYPDAATGQMSVVEETVLTVTRTGDNVYEGTGTTKGIIDPANSVESVISILAFFDFDSCALTGSLFSFETGTVSVFKLDVYPESMIGPYVKSGAEATESTGRLDVRYS